MAPMPLAATPSMALTRLPESPARILAHLSLDDDPHPVSVEDLDGLLDQLRLVPADIP